MKGPLLKLAVAAVVVTGGCSKFGTDPNDSGLSGSYTWVSSTGGIAGRTFTPATEHYSVQFTFTGNQLRVMRNDSLKTTTNVEVTSDNLSYQPAVSVFAFDPQMEAHTVRVRGDTVWLSDLCCDRYAHTFVKQ